MAEPDDAPHGTMNRQPAPGQAAEAEDPLEPGVSDDSVSAPTAERVLGDSRGSQLAAPQDARGENNSQGDDSPEPAAKQTMAQRFPAAILALLVIAAAFVVVTVVLAVNHQSGRRDIAERQAVLVAARQEVINLTTLDQKTASADINRLLEGSTGDFRSQFGGQADTFGHVLTTSQVSSKGEVQQAGLVQFDGKSAVVLVAATAHVRNIGAPQGEDRNYRLRVKLSYENGRWLVSDVEFVA